MLGGLAASPACAANTEAPPAPVAEPAAVTLVVPAASVAPPITPASPAIFDLRAPLEALVAAVGREKVAMDAELECMAKVVHHEAGNQSIRGQVAVAQVIENRRLSGRFPKTVCSVVNQPGQFFATNRYNVLATSKQWLTAVAVARAVRLGQAAPVAPGALFFHAASSPPARGRFRLVAQIGANVFYR